MRAETNRDAWYSSEGTGTDVANISSNHRSPHQTTDNQTQLLWHPSSMVEHWHSIL